MPYRTCYRQWQWISSTQQKMRVANVSRSARILDTNPGSGDLKKMVKENAVIVIALRDCCMSYVVKRLLQLVGANPAVYEVEENDVYNVVGQLGGGGNMQFPAVFIGGRWFGGLERVIATHITEELTPLLKQAGALWL